MFWRKLLCISALASEKILGMWAQLISHSVLVTIILKHVVELLVPHPKDQWFSSNWKHIWKLKDKFQYGLQSLNTLIILLSAMGPSCIHSQWLLTNSSSHIKELPNFQQTLSMYGLNIKSLPSTLCIPFSFCLMAHTDENTQLSSSTHHTWKFYPKMA